MPVGKQISRGIKGRARRAFVRCPAGDCTNRREEGRPGACRNCHDRTSFNYRAVPINKVHRTTVRFATPRPDKPALFQSNGQARSTKTDPTEYPAPKEQMSPVSPGFMSPEYLENAMIDPAEDVLA